MLPRHQELRVSATRPLLGKAHNQDWKTRTAVRPRGYRLIGHLIRCLEMTRLLFDNPKTPFGRCLYDSMRLDRFTTYEQFRNTVFVAVLCHDLGKAGDEFQEMIYRVDDDIQRRARKEAAQVAAGTYRHGRHGSNKRYRQTFRHEFLSGWLMWNHPEIRAWVTQATGSEAGAILAIAGATGHHRQSPLIDADNAPAYQVRLKELTAGLRKITPSYGFQPFPNLGDTSVTSHDLAIFARVNPGKDSPLAQAVRWSTIICDVLGSFTWSKNKYRKDFEKNLIQEIERIYRPIDVDHYTENHKVLWEVQREVRENRGLSGLLVDFPGAGKSTMGCLWAPRDRYYVYCSPTTGIATEQFKQMAASRGGEGPPRDAFYHSRRFNAVADLATCGEQAEQASESPSSDPDLIEEFSRFGYERSFVTVDQVLGVMVNTHKSVLWLLHLVRSAVVFDEFHSYDPKLFGALLQFMETFPGIPVLAMSATVSEGQRRDLGAARDLIQIYGYRSDSGARRLRYRIHLVSESDVPELVARPNKTLWIVNRVSKAQEWARLYPEALLYHARFRFLDREERHKQFIDWFSRNQDFLAIATQVSEMGFDISASTLISEIGPIAAMIQRLGRLARHAADGVGHAFFYLPGKADPYNDPAIQAGLAWLKTLEGRELSAFDLHESFQHLVLPFAAQKPKFARNVLWTSATELRDVENSVLALWEPDLAADPSLRWDRRLIRRHEVQMDLPPDCRQNLPYVNYHYILPQEAYDLRLGGLLEKVR